MQKIWNKWTDLSMRNRTLLLFFFLMAFCGNIHTRWSKSLLYFFLVPVMMYLALQQYKDKLVRRTPVLLASLLIVAWAYFSYMINNKWDPSGMVGLWGLALSWLFVLQMPKNMGKEEIRKQIFTIGCVFIFCFLPFMIVAIVTIFTGIVVRVPGNHYPLGIQRWGGVGTRVRIMMNPNYMGRITAYNMLFSIFAIMTHEKKWVKALFGIILPINLIIFVHSQSRTCYIAFALALGILAYRLVITLLHSRRAMRIAAGLLACVLVFFVALEGFNVMLSVDTAIAEKTSLYEPKETETRVDEYGQFDAGSSGRGEIWGAIMNYLKENPRYLALGMGTSVVMDKVSESDDSVKDIVHPHSSYLDSLCRGGIPFVLLLLAFLCMMVPKCWNMIMMPTTQENRGFFLVPVFIAMMLVMGVAEAFLFVGLDYSNVLFMCMCGYALHYTALEKEAKPAA